MNLELRHLRTVRAIADAGSLTKAAGELGLAQPALTTQLQRIERLLGGPLFVRDHSGARLTPLGELVVERARVVLPAVSELQAEAIRLARSAPALRRLRLGGTHGPLLAGLVDRLSRDLPDLPVSVQTSWSVDEISTLTAEARLDYALIGVCGSTGQAPLADRLTWRALGTDPVFVMLSETHPLAGRSELDLRDLAAERWASAPGDGCFGDCFATACARAGFHPTSLLESEISSCLHLIQLGRAVGLCRATFAPAPGIVTLPLAGTPLSWRHLLGWQPGSPAADAAGTVAAVARTAYGDALARNPVYAAWLPQHPGYGPAA
ncbi:LysR family transcriptional regulator [Streptomyces aidingensis]|uniref:DNA-binding transcriptional regulator, LysR family n=1 Tax=Streptomyces aidingensis TaxID=910347 RepID=A0A1I1J2P2_9ACTN|nr:LysR family transcriptional regulator [Streptomyces aidingensis]SFC42381.1 DNA-binding transcriptional regulator, LysR family [Streptomyces aidingensis]